MRKNRIPGTPEVPSNRSGPQPGGHGTGRAPHEVHTTPSVCQRWRRRVWVQGPARPCPAPLVGLDVQTQVCLERHSPGRLATHSLKRLPKAGHPDAQSSKGRGLSCPRRGPGRGWRRGSDVESHVPQGLLGSRRGRTVRKRQMGSLMSPRVWGLGRPGRDWTWPHGFESQGPRQLLAGARLSGDHFKGLILVVALLL